MKRSFSASNRSGLTTRLQKSGPNEELTLSRGFNENSADHRAIRQLVDEPASKEFASRWRGPDPQDLLAECNARDWVKTFTHLAKLFGLTAITEDIQGPSADLIAHVLCACPEIVDLRLEEFSADESEMDTLEQALSSTHHLRSFHFQAEYMEMGGSTRIAQGLSAHHHLQSWSHWTEDQPDVFVPVLKHTLACLRGLQCLDLCIDVAWSAAHFDVVARQLRLMPNLRELSLTLTAPCDLSSFFQTLCASPLATLKIDLDAGHLESTRQTAQALVRAITCMPSLSSLSASLHVLQAMGPSELVKAVKTNGAISTITSLDINGRPRQVRLDPVLASALAVNVDRFHLAPPDMFGPACSVFVNTVLARYQWGPVQDIGTVVSRHLMGEQTPADMRDCQGLLRVSRDVWSAARDARRDAMLKLLQRSGGTDPAIKDHLTRLCLKFGIITNASDLPPATPGFPG